MTDLYLVVSEILSEVVPVLDYGQGPMEDYAIVCLVAAKSRGAAKWAAWQTDKSFDGDVHEMPKFYTRRIGRTRRPEGTIIDIGDDPLWKRVPASAWESLPRD